MQEDRRLDTWILPLGLALMAFVVFSRSVTLDFINFDDFDYVASNPKVNRGLGVESFLWALTSNVGANWHPVTILSHMADSTVYGVQDAWGHHLTNVLLHAANTALLFLLLNTMTGARWQSVLVAALFGIHPLHVESVTWVAERKDVLSTFFWFSSLWAYAWYVKQPKLGRYFLVALLMALGLMSKPMVVTAPCLMLVLDFWPLRRLFAPSQTLRQSLVRFVWLVVEKVPFFLIVATTSVITFLVQLERGVRSTEILTVKLRILNMLASYGDYITQFVWPTRLAVFYPHPTVNLSLFKVGISTYALLILSLLALAWWRKRPYMLAGWLWYLGTLIPVIGLVQVGGAARADRYTYVPLVGLFVVIAWGLAEVAASGQRPRRIVTIGCVVWLTVLAGLTWHQQGHWKDSITLFRHTAKVADPERNFLAHSGIATALKIQGDYEAALIEFNIALKLFPRDRTTYVSKADLLKKMKRYREATRSLEAAIALGMDGSGERYSLGTMYFELGEYEIAAEQFRKALNSTRHPASTELVNPPEPRVQLSLALQALQRYDEAKTVLEEGLAESPENIHYETEYAWLLATCPDESIRDQETALEISSRLTTKTNNQEIRILDVYAAALANALRFSGAVRVAQEAIDLGEGTINSLNEQIETQEWREWKKPPTDLLEQYEILVAAIKRRIQLYKEASPYRHDAKEGRY